MQIYTSQLIKGCLYKSIVSHGLCISSLTSLVNTENQLLSYKVHNITNEASKRKCSSWSNVFGKSGEVPQKNYEIIRPVIKELKEGESNSGSQDILRSVPSHVNLPEYAHSSIPHKLSMEDTLTVWNKEEINRCRKSCKIARYILRTLANIISSYSTQGWDLRDGKLPKYRDMPRQKDLTTNDLNNKAHEMILSLNSYPSSLNYAGFPKSIKTSVNNVVCCGIPDDRPLKSGDIISVQVAVYHDGFHGDCAETFVFGDVCDTEGYHLVNSAKECMFAAIASCAPGAPFRAIGYSLSKFAKRRGVKVIPTLAGHGIGTNFQMGLDILHVPNHYLYVMKPGHIFTVEPHIVEGYSGIELWDEDGFSLATRDHSRGAVFTHTVLITEHGVDILSI